MHIAIASMEFVTEDTFGGGLANYSANLARVLRNHGNRISVFVISSTDEQFEWEENITIYRVQYLKCLEKFSTLKIELLKKMISSIWSFFGASVLINRKIVSVHKKDRIDIVHFCSSGALSLFRRRRIPAVVRLSTFLPAVRKARMPQYEYDESDVNLFEKIQFIAIRKADCIFAPSYNVARLTEKRVNRKVEVIESPFYLETMRTDESSFEDYLKEKPYFLFYGTLGYLKGVHTIAPILNKLFKTYPQYFFVFIGNNSKMLLENHEVEAIEYIRGNVSQQYQDNIIYFPALGNKEQLYSVIRHTEACVLPSRFDNLPNTCIESMALGQIVIGTNGASFEQLIQDGYNGFLIERENSVQLYQKMIQVIKMSNDEKTIIRQRARESVVRLNPDVIYEKIMKIYQKAIKEVQNKK